MIPDESGTINEEAVRFYHRYFDELIENGIEPFVNLYHLNDTDSQRVRYRFQSTHQNNDDRNERLLR